MEPDSPTMEPGEPEWAKEPVEVALEHVAAALHESAQIMADRLPSRRKAQQIRFNSWLSGISSILSLAALVTLLTAIFFFVIPTQQTSHKTQGDISSALSQQGTTLSNQATEITKLNNVLAILETQFGALAKTQGAAEFNKIITCLYKRIDVDTHVPGATFPPSCNTIIPIPKTAAAHPAAPRAPPPF